MKTHLDTTRVTQRRIALELSVRQVARSCGVSGFVISRIERTGEIEHLQVSVLHRYLETLQLDLSEELADTPLDGAEFGNHTAQVGGFLADQTGRVTEVEIADRLGLTLEEVQAALVDLGRALRPAGLAVHSAHSDGIKLVPAVLRPDDYLGDDVEERKRRTALGNLNASSLRLLYEVVFEARDMKHVAVATSGDRFVALSTLINAGLVDVGNGQTLQPTKTAKLLLGLDQHLPPVGTPGVPNLDDDSVVWGFEDDVEFGDPDAKPFDELFREPGRHEKATVPFFHDRPWRDRPYL